MAKYVPALTIRNMEMRALANLAGPTKDLVFPVVSLQAWPNASKLERSLEKLEEAFATRPLALDLADAKAEVNDKMKAARDHLASLHDESDGFQNWCDLVATRANIIPVVQWSDSPLQLNGQIEKLAGLGRGLVFRFRKSKGWNLGQLGAVDFSELQHVPKLMILDYEQIGRKEDLTLAGHSVQNAALAVKSALGGLHADFTFLGSSFPSQFSDIHPTTQKLQMKERVLHSLVAASPPILAAGITLSYGDHAAVYAAPRERGYGGPPRVDYPTADSWIYHRRTKAEGFVPAATAVMAEPDWDDALLCWGAQEIRRAAAGNVTGLGALSPWTGVRIAIHMHLQAHAGGDPTAPIEEPWEE